MKKSNVNAALKLLTDNMQNGILPLNDGMLNNLKEKHPQPKEICNILLICSMLFVFSW